MRETLRSHGMRRYSIVIAAMVGFCSVYPSWALELNFGGEEIRVPTGEEVSLVKREKGFQIRVRSQVYGTRLSGDVSRSFKD